MLNFKPSKNKTGTDDAPSALSGTRPVDAFQPNSQSLKPSRDELAQETSMPGLAGTFLQQSQLSQFTAPVNTYQAAAGKKYTSSGRRRYALGFFIKFSLLFGVLVIAAGGFLTFKAYLTSQKIFSENDRGAVAINLQAKPSDLSAEGDGRINIVLAGKGGSSHQDGGELTDSLILVSIDPFAKTASVLSIPRDLYVDVPGFWSMKINAVYAVAKTSSYDQSGDAKKAELDGMNKLSDTIEDYIGVPIHYYVMVDFIAFEEIIDTVGGVKIDVESRLYDPTLLPEILLDIYPGEHTFDGRTALYYARSRATSPGGDFDRSQRQRQLLLALRDNIVSARLLVNPLKLNSILDTVGGSIHTNISIEEATKMYDITKGIDTDNIHSLSFVDDPILVTTTVIGDQSVVIPVAGINDYRAIKAFVRNRLLDGFINRENASITVLNGSGIHNLATQRANELKSYGYNVVEITNAPTSDYISTVLIANTTTKVYTQEYLENRLDVQAVDETLVAGELSRYTSDFVIIIGVDESSYN